MLTKIDYAYLETTNHCNLDCSFCNRSEVVKKPSHMSLSKWVELMERLKVYPIKEAKLMGMGEPFLHPEYHKICAVFKEYFPEAFVISATNAQYKINENFAKALQNIDMLYLSIDGYKESYEKYRQNAGWDKLIAFLEDLQKTDRCGCNVTVNYVVNPYNVCDIEKIAALCEKYNLGELRLNIAQDWTEGENADLGYSEEQKKYLKDNWQPNIKGKAPWTYSDCFWARRGLYINLAGGVNVCCMNTSTAPFGNIFEKDLEEIRAGDRFQEVQQGIINNSPSEHCKGCSYKQLSPLLEELLS